MKKLLLALAILSSLAVASPTPTPAPYNNLLPSDKGVYSPLTTYSLAPILGTSYLAAPMVTELSGLTFVMNGQAKSTLGVLPESSAAWSPISASGGSVELTLPDSYIFVGNASDTATPVPASGAMTLNNAGQFHPVESFFWVTGSGYQLNSITGLQNQYGSIPFSPVGMGSQVTVTGTYSIPCKNVPGSIILSIAESTAMLGLTSKVLTQTVSGFTAEIENANITTGSDVGTLQYSTTCS